METEQAVTNHEEVRDYGIPINLNRCNNINIEQVDIGYMVRVGCKQFAIEDKVRLIRLLTSYIDDPNNLTSYFNKEQKLP